MQLRTQNNNTFFPDGSRNRFIKTSSALFLAGSVFLALPMTSEAFVPSSFSQHKAPSTQLYYTMPDVTNMEAREMRQELESYGINTQTLFDKREFEQALIEARHHYEQTLNDVMSSTRPKEKKKIEEKRRTVHYNRGRHSDERIYSNDVNDQPGQQQQRRRRQYNQAEPNPVGNFSTEPFNTYPNNGRRNVGVGGSRSRPGNEWFEEDPLFEHEKQAQHFRPNGDHQQYRATYNNPAKEMKYQAALQESYMMKVEDLQHELNCRGISTKYCMIFRDFCMEYAKAIAEEREKSMSSDSDETIPFEDEGDDDDAYDPTYRDVVMQKYDPSMWI